MEELSDKEKTLIRWLNGELSEEELLRFKTTDEFKYYKSIVSETSTWQLPLLETTASYNRLKEKKEASKKGRSLFMNLGGWQTGIAASLLLVACFVIYTFFIKSDLAVHTTLAGETSQIELPDGSIVYLNAVSEISYRKKEWKRKRKIKLKGNAYFDVQKGGDFEVESDHGTVAVKGTEFEINDGSGFYMVQCLEGRVEVNLLAANETVVLDSSNVITYTRKKGLHRSKTARGKHRSWANGKSSFTNAPLAQVFEAMKKQFNIEFNFGNVALEQKFTGEFVHSSIETALKMVCVPMQIEYEIKGNKIALKRIK